MYKWDKKSLFSSVDFNKIHSIVEDYIKMTTDKDTMKEIESEIASKYSDSRELKDDVYCHALAIASGETPDDRKLTDRKMARSGFMAKLRYDEKIKYMGPDHTKKCLKALKNIKDETSMCISSMQNTFVNPGFEKLLAETEKESKLREDNTDSRKYKYYRLRYDVLSAAQEAANDVYRMKITLMKSYAKECYASLKALDSYKSDKSENVNESISLTSNEIKGYTLHA